MAVDMEKAEEASQSQSQSQSQSHSPDVVLQDLESPPVLQPEVQDDGESNKEAARSPVDSIEPAAPERPEAPPQGASLKPAPAPAPSLSRAATATAVPRSKRRGLLGRLTIIPEVERPYDYANSTKWVITIIVSAAAAAAPLGSAIFFPALGQISRDFHASKTLTNLAVAMYLLSIAIFPLWWSAFSEVFGRRTIYLVSFTLFTLWNVISAISTSIGMLIVMRVLGGGAAASVLAIGAGTLADCWEPKERGRAMGIFFLGPLLGPLLAPIIGGLLTQAWGWRSTQWFQTIYGGVLLIVLTFCLPETLANRTPAVVEQQVADRRSSGQPDATPPSSTWHSVQRTTKQAAVLFKRFIIDPLKIIGYLRFPAVLATVYIGSITFGSLYLLNIAIQRTYQDPPYNFSEILIGLTYIPGSLGYLVASLVAGRWADNIMHREARATGRYDESGKLVLRPEDRMRENVLLAAAVYPAGLVWFGWTAEKGVFWIVPLLANFVFGFGTMIIFGTATTMLTEFLPKRSSSGVAVSTFVRTIFSCVGSVVAQPLLQAIGDGWLFTILGIVGWISAFTVVWAMKKYGSRWQNAMKQELVG